jgi:hypothetical protein
MDVPLAVAVPWLAAEATATLVGAPPERFNVMASALESYATVADVAPATGGAIGVTEFENPEGRPVPAAFVAVTLNTYVVPLVRPVTVIGELVPVPVIDPGVE